MDFPILIVYPEDSIAESEQNSVLYVYDQRAVLAICAGNSARINNYSILTLKVELVGALMQIIFPAAGLWK